MFGLEFLGEGNYVNQVEMLSIGGVVLLLLYILYQLRLIGPKVR